MRFTAEFNMDNAAFEFPYEHTEVSRIFRGIENSMSVGICKGVIRDINGNTIGSWEVKQ